MRAMIRSRWTLLLGIGMWGIVLAGCGGGGGGSSSTGPTATSGTLTRVEGRVVTASTAQAPAGSLLAWVTGFLHWSRAAEAQVANCTVSAPGATPVTTNSNGEFVLLNVPIGSSGSVTLTFACPGVASGTLTLENLPPGAVVKIQVDVRPGRVAIKTKNVDVNPSPSPNVSPMPSPKVSPPKGTEPKVSPPKTS